MGAHAVQELINQLTLEEKVALTAGHTYWRTPSVPRLGIKAIKTSDGPNGCRGESIHASTKASCFPCGACMGATWNFSLLQQVGKALAKECKMKNVGVLLGPTINIHRHPYGGRTFESFSEDAVLSGELAAAYVQGLQSQNVAACLKHFVCNECEVGRHDSNSVVDEKTLRELYLLPFQICIRKSNPWSLMTAYNKVNGTWCSENPFLLKQVLREEWKYKGCVMSDFGGVYTSVEPVRQGLNLEMPGPSTHRGERTIKLVKEGELAEKEVEGNVAHVIQLSHKVGMEDEDRPEEATVDKENCAVIRQAALEGIVLLKNSDLLLPINPDAGIKVAVFGAPATSPIMHGGGSPSLTSHYVSTPLQALRVVYPDLKYSYGVPIFRKIPSAPIDCMKTASGEPGVDCHWYNGWTFGENEVHHERLDTTRTLVIDPRIPGLDFKHCSRMSCTLMPRTTGNHTFGVTANGETHIYIDDEEVVSHPGFTDTKVEYIMQPWRFEERATLFMKAGQEYCYTEWIGSG